MLRYTIVLVTVMALFAACGDDEAPANDAAAGDDANTSQQCTDADPSMLFYRTCNASGNVDACIWSDTDQTGYLNVDFELCVAGCTEPSAGEAECDQPGDAGPADAGPDGA